MLSNLSRRSRLQVTCAGLQSIARLCWLAGGMRGRLLCDEASEATSYRRGGGGWDVERGRLRRPGEGEQARNEGDHKGQSISKKRASRFCHPERSEGSLSGQRSFAALRMTILPRLRLTRKTSSLKWIDHKGSPLAFDAGESQIKNCL